MKMGDEWKENSKLQPHQSVAPHNCELFFKVCESNPISPLTCALYRAGGTDKRYLTYNKLIAILKEQA
jgi:hypothetical protein